MRAWSFQSKLGIICNTLIQAAPQLAHLLVVIFASITLFALLSYLAIGQRVPYTSSYAASFEETFSALLGLGYVKLPDVFPPDVAQSPPQVLLCLLVYYLREVLFVMVLMNFFMSTLGDQFMELKKRKLGSQSSATSILQDIAQHVVPELGAKAKQAARLRVSCRGLWKRRGTATVAVAPDRDSNSSTDSSGSYSTRSPAGTCAGSGAASVVAAAGSNTGTAKQPRSAEALLKFLKAHYPALTSSKAFGDKVPAIRIVNRHLDLAGLQQLLAQLALQEASAEVLLQTPPARAFVRQNVIAAGISSTGPSNRTSSSSHSSGGGTGGPSIDAGASLLERLGSVGRAVVAAGAPAGAVAAALAAAEQLMATCGAPVDAQQLSESAVQPQQADGDDVMDMQEQTGAGDDDAEGAEGAAASLQPGRDYTVQVGLGGWLQFLLCFPRGYTGLAAALQPTSDAICHISVCFMCR